MSNDKIFNYNMISKYRSMIMGLSIISIIFLHYVTDCNVSNVSNFFNDTFFNYINSAGVDIFLFLSGFGLYYSYKKNNDTEEFYRKRFLKILIPYIIFCLPAIIIRYGIIKSCGIMEVIKQFTFYSFMIGNGSWFWYVLMILTCYFIFPYIFKVFDKANDETTEEMRLLILCSLSSIISLIILQNYTALYSNINKYLLRFPPFFLGILIGKRAYYNKGISLKKLAIFVILSFFFIFISVNFGGKAITNRYIRACFLLSLFLIVILLFEKFKENKIFILLKKSLEKIGSYTFELYITHVAFREFIKMLDMNTSHFKYFLLEIIISVIFSLIIKFLTDLILRALKYKKKIHSLIKLIFEY